VLHTEILLVLFFIIRVGIGRLIEVRVDRAAFKSRINAGDDLCGKITKHFNPARNRSDNNNGDGR